MGRVRRSGVTRDEAKKHYIALAEKVILEQLEVDARRLDREDDAQRKAVGPFARLSAERVASLDAGRSRGAITNLFGSQREFQLETMSLALEDPAALEDVGSPDPRSFDDDADWVDALATFESRRGPLHETEIAGYAAGWVLWLGQVPYGVWSDYIAEPSMKEFRGSTMRLEREAIRPALEHFGREIRPPWTSADLATAIRSMLEGVWLNQCLTPEHPTRPDEAAVRGVQDALRMLWQGATQPVPG